MDSMEIAKALVRLETKLDAVLENKEIQEEHNRLFYEVRDKVNKIEAKASGIWLASGFFGGVVAWIVSLFRGN